MRFPILVSTLVSIFAGCGTDTYLIVTVDAPGAVHDVTKLEVSETDNPDSKVGALSFRGSKFPVTFSMSGLRRTGSVDLTINAFSNAGLVVGTGHGQAQLDTGHAMIHLDATDFVVNSDFTQDQFLTQESDAVGTQLAATPTGRWIAAFSSSCTSCDVFARRFDANGIALTSADADGTDAFRVTTMTDLRGTAAPAVATSRENSIVVWAFDDTNNGNGSGVACRGIDPQGSQTASEQHIAFENAASVDAAPLADGNFSLSWLAQLTPPEVHTMVVRPDCTTPSPNPIPVSAPAKGNIFHSAHIASNGNAVIYAWIVDGNVHFRVGDGQGTFSPESSIAAPSAEPFSQVRVAAMGTGFAVAVRTAATVSSMPGSIAIYRATEMGALVPDPIVITNQSGSNASTGQVGFGIATRNDGAVMLVWQQCDDGSSGACVNRLDVFGRLVRPDGNLAGTPFLIPTTTAGNQSEPSVAALDGAFVVAWNDASMTDPDTSSAAVRARIIYPSL